MPYPASIPSISGATHTQIPPKGSSTAPSRHWASTRSHTVTKGVVAKKTFFYESLFRLGSSDDKSMIHAAIPATCNREHIPNRNWSLRAKLHVTGVDAVAEFPESASLRVEHVLDKNQTLSRSRMQIYPPGKTRAADTMQATHVIRSGQAITAAAQGASKTPLSLHRSRQRHGWV